MKVLILTWNAGGGHHAAAASLKEAFANVGCSCEVADVLQFISKRISLWIGNLHNWTYRHAPGMFNRGYQFTEQHRGMFQEDSEVYKILTVGAEKLKNSIAENGYDMVVCTHVFCAVILTEALKNSGLKIKTAFTATDYTCSPSLEESNLDWYFIPDDSLIPEFVQKGLPKEKLKGTGIPVANKFSDKMPIEEAKRLQGIRPEQKHLLMMCGSMGCGPLKELAEDLAYRMPADAILTVVCGNNESLYRKLNQRLGDHERVRVLGYTNQVSQLMDSADIYLTKAGGLSTSEALNKNLPMCLIDAVAGCEEYNANFFVGHRMAVAAEDEDELLKLCMALLADEEQLAAMRDRMKQMAPVRPAEKMVDFLLNGAY